MKYFLFLFCLPFLPLKAQVGIYITGDYPFKIGIDGYVQNTEAVKKLAIQELDTGLHFIWLNITDGESKIAINRKLKLVKRGSHHYIITKNFKGKLQLRYRGTINTIPTGIITMKLQSMLPLPEEAIADNQTKKEQFPNIPAEKTVTEKVTVKTITAPSEELNIEIIPDTAEPVLEVDKFPVLLEEMNKAEFEFIKLNLAKEYIDNEKSLSSDKLISLLQSLEYDNSRLQLITYSLDKLESQGDLGPLENTLDYELSKESLKNILNKN